MRSGTYTLKNFVKLRMKLPHCHSALGPMPWIRSRLGFDSVRVLGTQQCIIVPSFKSVVVERRPEPVNFDRWQRFLVSVKLKHFVI